MRFITEIDLRDLYTKEPFTTYNIELETRLTPGAREFLSDHRIKILDNGSCKDEDTVEKQLSMPVEKKSDWREKKLYSKMKSIESLFLLTARELLDRDVFLAQGIINLGKQFTNIKNALEGKGEVKDIKCKECLGINIDNFSHELDNCFEITDFHIQLERGKDIIILHNLRCILYEVEPVILELYENSECENQLYKDVIGKVNQIINTLSQIICSILGGKKCQRKS